MVDARGTAGTRRPTSTTTAPTTLAMRRGPAGHDEHVDDADDGERHDRRRRRRQREALPAADGRDVVRARALERGDQQHADDLQHDDAAEEREEVAPALEGDGRDEQGDRDDGQRPPGRHPVDAAGDRRQPRRCARSAMARRTAASTWSVTRRAHGDEQGDRPATRRARRRRRSSPGPVRPMLRGQRRRGAGRPAPATLGRARVGGTGAPSPASTGAAWRRPTAIRCVTTTHLRPPRGDDRSRRRRRVRRRPRSARGRPRSSAAPRRRRSTSTDVVAPPLDDLGAHERGDVLGRLQPAVVGQLDEVGGRRSAGSVREQQGDVDVALSSSAWRVSGPPASSATNSPKRSP